MFDVAGPSSRRYRRPSITATAPSSNEEDRVKCHMELGMGKTRQAMVDILQQIYESVIQPY